MMRTPRSVTDLVKLFKDNYDDYKKASFNETQVRRQFIDPLFEAMGWDVTNRNGYAEQYKEVVHEDSLTDDGKRKAPDYSFRIGRERKFFLEAKKPSVELDKDKAPAYQIRRYAWSSKLPLSIITNFEELAIYDTRFKPEKDDGPKVARILRFHFEEYEARWSEISGLLSKDAVLKGAFDRFATSKIVKKGTTAVDEDFLDTIGRWRSSLAEDLYSLNKNLDESELSFAVQSLIDRILFIRICEDKGLEKYEALRDATKKSNSYKHLLTLFSDAQKRYNSGLFHVFPEGTNDKNFDVISNKLRVSDGVLNKVIEDVYFPKSPYEFSVISSEILGSVYERFLGSTISLDQGKVSIEVKPELKKAGGIYYTPVYIVDYMSDLVLGSDPLGLVSASELPKLKILDMACGSGTFLIQVYDHLLFYYRAWHLKRGKRSSRYLDQVQTPDGRKELRLKFSERRRILLDHIFGVDIDPQAVEVTKLSLFLKLIEDTTVMPAQFELSPFQKRLLPDMSSNIKCGNSLVGTDIILSTPLSNDEIEVFKPFDWSSSDGFPEIMAQGGFDAVVGNPPYSYRKSTVDKFKNYYQSTYATTEGNFDTYKMFLEKGIKLLKAGGRICQIVNSSFLIQPQFLKLRAFLDEELQISELDVLGSNVFSGVTIDTAIIAGERRKKKTQKLMQVREPGDPLEIRLSKPTTITQSRFKTNPDHAFDWRLSDSEAKIVDRLSQKFSPLEDICDLSVGINTGSMKSDMTSDVQIDTRYHPCVPGNGISRYGACNTDGWILYDPVFIKAAGDRGRSLPPESFFSSDKILVVRTRNTSLKRRIISTIDLNKFYNLNRLSNVVPKCGVDIYTIQGIMNSELWNFLFLTRFFNYEIKPVYLKKAPVAVKMDQRLSTAVRQRIQFETSLATASIPTKKVALKTSIESSELTIDTIVYDLFEVSLAERLMIRTRLSELPGK